MMLFGPDVDVKRKYCLEVYGMNVGLSELPPCTMVRIVGAYPGLEMQALAPEIEDE
jgi:hypothetical protein